MDVTYLVYVIVFVKIALNYKELRDFFYNILYKTLKNQMTFINEYMIAGKLKASKKSLYITTHNKILPAIGCVNLPIEDIDATYCV